MVQGVMKDQAFFKHVFKVFLEFDILNEDLIDLKSKLSESLLALGPENLCFAIKDDIVNLIQN